MTPEKKPKRFSVFSVVDRGENAKPRYYGGYCNLFNLTIEDAEKLAAEERAKPYICKVEIRETENR